jgi:ferredoxin-NADP reductase
MTVLTVGPPSGNGPSDPSSDAAATPAEAASGQSPAVATRTGAAPRTATTGHSGPRRPTASARVRSWVQKLTTPLLPEDYLTLINPLWSGRELRGKVVEVRHEAREAVSVVIRPGSAWTTHTPGQYVRVGVVINGVKHWRTYSLTSLPGAPDGLISFSTKAIPDGVVSGHIVHHLRAGDIVALEAAQGEFTVPDQRPERMLFLTGGSGMTPVMGILRSLEAAGELAGLDVTILHSAPTPEDVFFADELRALAEKRAGSLRLHIQHTDDDGMLTAADIAGLVPDWAERETWACGPGPMLDMLQEHWVAGGLEDKLHVERFRIGIGADVDLRDTGGKATFERSGIVAAVAPGATILVSGESAGALLPSGCRMGICRSCVGRLTSGAVQDLRTGEVIDTEGVMVQTCINTPVGDCSLDL